MYREQLTQIWNSRFLKTNLNLQLLLIPIASPRDTLDNEINTRKPSRSVGAYHLAYAMTAS